MNFYKDKKVLVTGSRGMIGKQLVELLVNNESEVYEADLKLGQNLKEFQLCVSLCMGMDYIFHLAGIKGSPRMTQKRPADFFVPMVQFNTNMLEAARLANVERFLYTSSIAVLYPEMDKYPAWAKKTGEMQIEAYRKQYGSDGFTIVRPANVYGPYDDFSNPDAMVVTSLINKVGSGKNPIEVWGDGSNVRDFIHAKDVARAMMLVMEKNPQQYPVNIGTGTSHSVRTLVNKIMEIMDHKPTINWKGHVPTGDQSKLLSTDRLKFLGFKPEFDLQKGLEDTIKWYIKNVR